MLNLQQLLERVFQQPNRSSCDKAVLGRIWEAFTTWCQEQFDAKLGVKMLGMGEFCMRHDVIGSLEFWNPMFVLAEAFARAHGLHDRRPKTQTSASESVEVDMAKIAQMTTELVGEVVIRDVVEAALLDIVDRIGASCADEALGVVTIDFVFGKLICENKSLEFHFHAKPGAAGAAAAGGGRCAAGGATAATAWCERPHASWSATGSAQSSSSSSSTTPAPPGGTHSAARRSATGCRSSPTAAAGVAGLRARRKERKRLRESGSRPGTSACSGTSPWTETRFWSIAWRSSISDIAMYASRSAQPTMHHVSATRKKSATAGGRYCCSSTRSV